MLLASCEYLSSLCQKVRISLAFERYRDRKPGVDLSEGKRGTYLQPRSNFKSFQILKTVVNNFVLFKGLAPIGFICVFKELIYFFRGSILCV